MDNRICKVLEWTLDLKRLAYSRIDLLCCSVSLHLKGTWENQNHQTFCVRLVLVSLTLIYRPACPLLVKQSTINLSLTSEESLRDSKPPVTGYLRTKGQESVYETCACVIHTNLLSYMCISLVPRPHSHEEKGLVLFEQFWGLC